ncbi:Putative RNA polymerase I-specific transcription initiation factor RRN6 [Colletotrichum destructivum]|uniref:RNA polymerase I-specific transcription initiation factor RRN6 n=1 Tax=Colletotrichum destructivum TaxID=34406 RepID=A0AAX4ID76_9PEZI|nr:Putative RNA polymerase I-specific transcription initiation factor RRN6 [Colletotrichum destructivum]
MADEREETGRLYGPPRITVVPHEGLQDGPPLLHTSRVPGQAQALRIVQPPESLFPASRSAEIVPSSTVWDSQRVQQRWLFNAHPEAFIGGSEAASFLAEDLTRLMRPEATPTTQPLLAITQMADVTNHTRVAPVPVVAMAAGESGELLRLSKIDEIDWRWGENENPALQIFSIDQHDREESVLWSHDGAPILQIKAALSLVRFEPTRWLLVQKRTSTTILQPEYHKVPVSERPPGIDKAIERPSRINPKPVLTITSEQTGGFAHSDVSFSYGSQKKPPQLAIVDECGYYSVWDVKGRDMVGSASMRPKLRHCGHIQLGVTEQLPDEDSPAFRPEPHGVLWIGAAGPGVDLWDVPTVQDPDTGNDLAALTARSKKLLLWNRTKFEVVDIKNPSFRESLSILRPNEPDRILDVKSNPLNQSQLFILTSSNIFWIETSSQGGATAKSDSLAVLQSFSHLRGSDADTLRLTVHHGGHGSGNETCALYLYSEKSPEVGVYWLSIPEETGLPQFEHHIVRLSDNPPKLQTVWPAPAFLHTTSSAAPKGPGANYMDQQVQFQQLFVLGRDLSLSRSLLAISAVPALEVVPPDNSREWSRDGRRQVHNKRRKQFLQHFEDTFIVPDGLGDMDELVQCRANRYQELMKIEQEKNSQQIQQRWPRSQNLDFFMSRITVSIESVIMASEHATIEGPLSIFEAIEEAAANCLETDGGYIPLHTLHEYEPSFEAPPISHEAVAAWDSRFQELLGSQTKRIVAQPIINQYLCRGDRPAPLADIRDQLLELWGPAGLPEGARQSRNVILAETAEAIARSLFGVAILDANLPTEESEPPTWVPEPPPQPIIQQPSQRSSQRFSLSPAKRNQLSSSQRLSLSPTKLSQPFSQRISLSPTKRGQAFGQRLSFSPSKGARSQSPYAPSSSIPFPFPSSGTFSQSLDASQADTPPTGAPSPSAALQRLSMLAEDLDVTNPPTRQHSVLAYWPTARGASADDYVSSVLASSTKHIDVINERRQRAESRRRKRRSQLLGSSAAATSSQTYGTQDEWEDSGPGTGPESVPPPATQPLPKLAPPVIGSSQVPPVVPSSQVIFSSQVPQVLSQPVSGRHAMRSPGKKKKRKSGF